MRWIVTADYWGNCLGMGEDDGGVPARGTPEQADALPMEFWLCDAKENVVFEVSMTVESGPRIFAQKGPLFRSIEGHAG